MAAKKTPSRPAPKKSEPEIVLYEVDDVMVLEGEIPEPLKAGEYVTITGLSDEIDGVQFYDVSALEDNEDGARIGCASHDELVEPNEEQQAYLNETYASEEDEEGAGEVEASEEAAEGEATTTPKAKAKGKGKGKVKGKGKALVLSPTLDGLISEQGGDIIAAVRVLADRSNETYFDIGLALVAIKANKSYTSILDENGAPLYAEKGGFAAFVDQELGIKYRTAQYWVQIVQNLKPLLKAFPEILSLGWPKAKELARVVLASKGMKVKELTDYIAPLVEFSKNTKHTVADIQDEIREKEYISVAEETEDGEAAATATNSPREARTKFSFFAMGPDEEALVNRAVALVKEQEGITDETPNKDGKIWLKIVDTFLAVSSSEAGTKPVAKAATATRPGAAKKVAAKAK